MVDNNNYQCGCERVQLNLQLVRSSSCNQDSGKDVRLIEKNSSLNHQKSIDVLNYLPECVLRCVLSVDGRA